MFFWATSLERENKFQTYIFLNIKRERVLQKSYWSFKSPSIKQFQFFGAIPMNDQDYLKRVNCLICIFCWNEGENSRTIQRRVWVIRSDWKYRPASPDGYGIFKLHTFTAIKKFTVSSLFATSQAHFTDNSKISNFI